MADDDRDNMQCFIAGWLFGATAKFTREFFQAEELPVSIDEEIPEKGFIVALPSGKYRITITKEE